MDNSPLAKLPRELRDEIWTLALTQGAVIHVHSTNPFTTQKLHTVYRRNDIYEPPSICSSEGNKTSHPLALTAACKQIREETAGLFYKHNSFLLHSELILDITYHVENTEFLVPYQNWISDLGERNSSALRHINIWLGRLLKKNEETESVLIPVIANFIHNVERTHGIRPLWTCTMNTSYIYHLDSSIYDIPIESQGPGIGNWKEQEQEKTYRRLKCGRGRMYKASCRSTMDEINMASVQAEQLISSIATAVSICRDGEDLLTSDLYKKYKK